MAATYNDNSVQYGSQILTLNSIAFVADNFETTQPSTVIERTNQLGEPSGSVGIAGFIRGTATVQLASSTHAAQITLGQDFTANSDTTTTYYITDISEPQVKDAEQKVNISFIQAYAP